MAGYFLYFIECANGTLYTGSTDDVLGRYRKHMAGTGSTWTRNNKPVRIVGVRRYESRKEAYGQERKLKVYSHDKKLRWIETNTHFDAEALSALKA